MKKSFCLILVCAGFLLASCDKDDIGGTATEALAGEWRVTVDAVDDDGNVVYEDFFGLGTTHLNTYNTAANVATQMYVDDLGYFWSYKVKVNCDVNAMTFSGEEVYNEYYDDCYVTIEDGKVMTKAATNPHGTASDSIVFYVSFSDDPYPYYYGYAKYKVSGYRYTGFVSDDE